MITGYTVQVDHALHGRPLQVFTELRFAGNPPVFLAFLLGSLVLETAGLALAAALSS